MARFTVVGPHRMVLDKRSVFESGDELEMDFERGNRYVQQGHLALMTGTVSDEEMDRFVGRDQQREAASPLTEWVEGTTDLRTGIDDDTETEGGDGR